MKKDIYPPLHLLKDITEEYPKVWEYMAYYHGQNKKNGYSMWPEWCYAPIGAAGIIVNDFPHVKNAGAYKDITAAMYSGAVAVLAPWRLSKEVYIIDPDLKELLFEQDGDLDIPDEILLQLPYQCFYVELPDTYYGKDKIHGFFVSLEYDVNTHDKELRLTLLAENGNLFNMPIHIGTKSIEENMEIITKQAHKNANDPLSKRAALVGMQYTKELSEFPKKIIQVVLYILAQNAEITPNSEQAIVTKRGQTVKDKYSEIRKWDVGVRIGAAIRQQKAREQAETESGTHNSPRPHMRRGHWHHFWTGPKAQPENRKLILKWLSPMAVAADPEDTPIVLHKVEL